MGFAYFWAIFNLVLGIFPMARLLVNSGQVVAHKCSFTKFMVPLYSFSISHVKEACWWYFLTCNYKGMYKFYLPKYFGTFAVVIDCAVIEFQKHWLINCNNIT